MDEDHHGKCHRGLNERQMNVFSPRRSIILRFCLAGLAAAVSITFFLSSPASANGQGVLIENTSPGKIESEPHQLISTIFRVVNRTKEDHEFDPVVDLPDGWELASSLFPFNLKAGEERFLFITASVPQAAGAGNYTISVRIIAADLLSISGAAEVEVEIIAVSDIEITPPPDIFAAYPGDSYTRVFIVTNRSNTSSRFEVKVKSSPEWGISFHPEILDLAPGESESVSVIASVPGDITREVAHTLTLTVESLDITNGQLSMKSRASTPVYPKLLPGDLYYNLPGSCTLIGAWEEDGQIAGQIRIDLEGEFGDGHYGEFHLIEPYPTRFEGRRFLQEDTFTLKYGIKDKGYLLFGDTLFDITPLTEQYYYGRGVDLVAEHEMFTFRAFAANRNSGWLSGHIAGSQLTTKPSEDTEFTLTAMTRREDFPDNGVNSDMKREGRSVTLLGKTNVTDGVVLIGEYGVGDQDNGDGAITDEAYMIGAEVETDRFRFDGELSKSGDHFPGYWQGSERAYCYISYDICPDFVLWGNLNKSQWRYQYEPDRSHTESIIRNIGANINAGDLGRISIYRRWISRTDINLFEWDDENITTNIQVSKHFNDYSVSGSAALGQEHDKLTGTSRDVEKYQVMFTTQRWGSVISSGYRWDIQDADEWGLRNTSKQFWLNADIPINERTKLVTRYSRNDGFEKPLIEWLRTDLKHDLGGDRKLEIITQWRGGDYDDELNVAVSLTFPLSIPLHWLPKSGWVGGMVYRAGETRIPLGGVVVSVGNSRVVTDKDGRFRIAGLDKGEYDVSIDRGSISLDEIADISVPYMISITAGDSQNLEIPIVKSASIAGRLIMNGNHTRSNGNGVNGNGVDVKGVTVVLTCEDVVLRRYTDKSGNFEFTDLRPGFWILEVPEYEIPGYHRIDPIAFEFDLLPGQHVEDIEFALTRTERPIEITISDAG